MIVFCGSCGLRIEPRSCEWSHLGIYGPRCPLGTGTATLGRAVMCQGEFDSYAKASPDPQRLGLASLTGLPVIIDNSAPWPDAPPAESA